MVLPFSRPWERERQKQEKRSMEDVEDVVIPNFSHAKERVGVANGKRKPSHLGVSEL